MNRSKNKDQNKKRSDTSIKPAIVGTEDGSCGYGSWEPGSLQCCNNAKGFLVVICLLITVQGKKSLAKHHNLYFKS